MHEQPVLIYADFPDPCVIVHDDTCYMTSTSMHYMPGIPILASEDLRHWRRHSYVYQAFENNAAHHLENKQNIYAQGSWATSFVCYEDIFYLCFNSNDTGNTYIYKTDSLESAKWQRHVLLGPRHDPSLLFYADRLFIVYGNGDLYYEELDYKNSFEPLSKPSLLLETEKIDGLRSEGAHWHYVNGYFYLFLIQWPKSGTARRLQWCYRSKNLTGPYEGKVILDEDMGFFNNGIAQGGIFHFKGEDYCMLFQDRGAIGRVPILFRLKWEEDWPVLKTENIVQNDWNNCKLSKGFEAESKSSHLGLEWQWNHIPDDRHWSLLERPGYLRLYSVYSSAGLEYAKNILTQVPVGSSVKYELKLDIAALEDGTIAGLACFHHPYAYIAVSQEHGKRFITYIERRGTAEHVLFKAAIEADNVYFTLAMNFENLCDEAKFAYSMDGEKWQEISHVFKMQYNLKHFVGNRPAIFCFSNNQKSSYVDIEYFRIENPKKLSSKSCD